MNRVTNYLNTLDKKTDDEINDDNEEKERNFISALFVEDDSECLINEQSLDSELEKILSGRKKITPEIVKVNDLYCHDDKGNLRPFIPVSMQKKIFNDYHLLSHPGAKSSINYLRKKYFCLECVETSIIGQKVVSGVRSRKLSGITKQVSNQFLLPLVSLKKSI